MAIMLPWAEIPIATAQRGHLRIQERKSAAICSIPSLVFLTLLLWLKSQYAGIFFFSPLITTAAARSLTGKPCAQWHNTLVTTASLKNGVFCFRYTAMISQNGCILYLCRKKFSELSWLPRYLPKCEVFGISFILNCQCTMLLENTLACIPVFQRFAH